ncbi:MAG: hypothetical protein H0W74_13750 [Sphingosinicella sp.]|nr:hypothetical protein [Sphingosinicella sp.]
MKRLALAAIFMTLPAASALQAQTAPTSAAPAPVPAAPVAVPLPTTSVGVNLNITPKRLTFDKRGSATVYIFNQGTTAAMFDISVADRVMIPTGDIKAISEVENTPEGKLAIGKLHSAKTLVRAVPIRATLAPGKGQTIRVRVEAPDSGAAEYRSHLTVTTLPPRDSGLTAEQAARQGPNELSFRVQTVFGLSIPLIVRTGPVDARAQIENVRLTYTDISPDGIAPPQRTPMLNLELVRSGTSSLFGNLEVKSATVSDKTPIGIARGVGVYTEIDRRSIRVPLRRAPKAGEQLNISFTDDDAKPGNVAARSTFTVG